MCGCDTADCSIRRGGCHVTIGLYYRLSIADGDLKKDEKEESNSIENQRLLLTEFVESRKDLQGDIKEYVDDGYTGTNFNRPAFKEMLEDAKKGNIQVIIVKDLSRLGRDYIGVGDYLEQIFPVLGIRFIAVNSNYDSDNYLGKTMGLETSISNLVNTLYSKDLSKKYCTAVRTKWKQGESTQGKAPYGYIKCKDEKSKWEIDPVASVHVRKIFELAMNGYSLQAIADYLNERKIPTRGKYHKSHIDYKQNRKVKDEEWLWDTYAIRCIIRNYRYTGALVQGTTKALRVGGKSRRQVPKHEQVIVDGVFPAIVTKEEFYAAQMAAPHYSGSTVRQKTGFSLGGKIRCGNCGLSMSYWRKNEKGTVACRHKGNVGKYSKCDDTIYDAEEIEDIVLTALQKKMELFQSLQVSLEEKPFIKDNQQIKKKLEKEIKNLKAKRIFQYESYAEGKISKDVYLHS